MPEFDLKAAREAGHSDEDIVGFLSKQLDFDLTAAQDAGYSTEDILSTLVSRVDTASTPPIPAEPFPFTAAGAVSTRAGATVEQPSEAPLPEYTPPTPSVVKDFLKDTGEEILQTRLKPLAAMLDPTDVAGTRVAQYVMTNGLEDALGSTDNADEAVQATIKNNMTNVLLTTFDVGAIAVAGPAQIALRQTAAKVGLQPALQAVFASAAEGAGYLSTYNALEATMEGHSFQEAARSAAEGAAIGAGIGAAGGLIIAGVEGWLARRAMRKAAEESVAGRQLFEDAKATLAEDYPHLTPSQLEENARRVAYEGKHVEDLPLPDPPVPSKGETGNFFQPDAETAIAFDQAVDELSRPAIPEVVIEERARRVPFFGEKDLRPYVRAEAKGPPDTLRDHINKVRNAFAGLFEAEPGATNEVKKLFFEARAAHGSASDRTDQQIYSYIFKHLGTGGKEVGEKTTHLNDYLVSMDRVATMQRKGAAQTHIPGFGRVPEGPGGTTYEEWLGSTQKLANKVKQHPELVQAAKAFRWLLDESQQIAMEYGVLKPSQYLSEYFPAQRLYEMASGLAQNMEGTATGRQLSAALKRNSTGEIIQTNMVKVLQKYLTALDRKLTEIHLWRSIEANPRINVTDLFSSGDPIPKGFKLYRPGPGMPGYVADDAIEEAVNGAIAATIPEARFTQGAFVLPEDVVNRLTHFYERSSSPVERAVHDKTNLFARQLTIYNLSNTSLNTGSDFLLALLGLPGEKSNVFGFLRFLPSSIKAAFRGAFGKEAPLYERAAREGIAGGTFIRSVGGEPVSKRLAPALLQGREPGILSKLHDFYDNLVRLRQAVEATPRIGAGQAAEARAGLASEFGRVGREITLPYGAGDPRISRVPLMRLLATFWRFQGMATARVFRLATTKGSRARGIAALVAPSVGAALWNLQNENFRQVEYSLGQYDRNHLHIIIPDPADPSQPFRKKNGQPMVFRMRFWVPEEIAGLFGLGNLTGRLIDVGAGYTSPSEFAGEVGGEIAENVVSLAAPLTTARQALTGRSSLTGQELERFERTETTLPAFYHFGKFFETAYNEGLLPALGQAPLRIVGIRPAGARLGRADMKILRLRGKLRDAQMRYRAAASKGDKFRMERFQKKMERLAQQLQDTQEGRARIERIEGQ